MLKGHWKLLVFEGEIEYAPNGWEVLNPLVEVIEGDNLITTSGKGMLLDRLYGLGAVGAMTQIGVGTSSTAAAVGDTTLAGLVLQAFDSTPTRAGLVVTSIATYGTGAGNISWNELGSFNASPTMLNRIAPIGPFAKTAAVSIVVTLTVTQS